MITKLSEVTMQTYKDESHTLAKLGANTRHNSPTHTHTRHTQVRGTPHHRHGSLTLQTQELHLSQCFTFFGT